jgi:16S rRNA (guanine527-N7)-methyltransferase
MADRPDESGGLVRQGDGTSASDEDLLAVLVEARRLGFLGPGPVEPHLEHALALRRAWTEIGREVPGPAEPCLDLGSGGGLPGLVLARAEPTTAWLLLDSGQRRASFLAWAIEQLHLGDRVGAVRQRAEEAGRDDAYRGGMSWVFARSFGPPAVTAECGAPLLRPGGVLVVAEPPELDPGRWPADGMGVLGLEQVGRGHEANASWVAFRLTAPCPPR